MPSDRKDRKDRTGIRAGPEDGTDICVTNLCSEFVFAKRKDFWCNVGDRAETTLKPKFVPLSVSALAVVASKVETPT